MKPEPAHEIFKFLLRTGCPFKNRGISGWWWAWASLSEKSWQGAAAAQELGFVCSRVCEWGVWLSCWLMKSSVWSNYWHVVSGTNVLCLGWGNNTSNLACSEHSVIPRERQVLPCKGQLKVGLIFGLVRGRFCECFRCYGKCNVTLM